MSELPKWPYSPRMSPCIAQIGDKPPDAYMHYAAPGEAAYVSAEAYDAALARLRVAVEALRARSYHLDCPDPHYACAKLSFNATGDEPCDCGAQGAIDALALIGDVP